MLSFPANTCFDDPIPVDNASPAVGDSISDRLYGQVAPIDCDEGYEFPDKDRSKNVTCESAPNSVAWSTLEYDACQSKSSSD